MKKLEPGESRHAKKKVKGAYKAVGNILASVMAPLICYGALPQEIKEDSVPFLIALSIGALAYTGYTIHDGVGCPVCKKSLFRVRGKYDRRLWPYCMHCGSHIFVDLPTLKLEKQQGAGPMLIFLIAIIGGTTAFFAYELEMPTLMWAGIIAATSSVFFYRYLNSVANSSCKVCNHPKGNHPFCENCGAQSHLT